MEDINPQNQKAENPYRKNKKETMPRHIIVKTIKVKDKNKGSSKISYRKVHYWLSKSHTVSSVHIASSGNSEFNKNILYL